MLLAKTRQTAGMLYWYVIAGPLFAGAILAATNAGPSRSVYAFLCEFLFVFLVFGPFWIGLLVYRAILAVLPEMDPPSHTEPKTIRTTTKEPPRARRTTAMLVVV